MLEQLDMELFLDGNYDIDVLGQPDIPLDVIEKHLCKCRQPIGICEGSLITWDFIKRQPMSTRWRTVDLVHMLNRHKMYSTMYDVLMNCCGNYYSIIPDEKPSLPDYIIHSLSHKVDLDFMIEHQFSWNWLIVIHRGNITWEDITKHKLYEKADPSYNPNITAEIVIENPQINWNFSALSSNHFRCYE